MKKLLITAVIASFATFTYAEDISYEKECPNGGSKLVSGIYDSTSGDFELTTEINDCGRYDEVVNGTHIAKGNFSIANSIFDPMAIVEAVVESDLSVSNEEGTITYSCTKTINGSYDMSTNTLDGTIKSDCNHSGKVVIPILDLLSGDDESDQDMDDEHEPNNEHENDYPNPDNIDDYKDQFNQCVNNNYPNNQDNQSGYPDYPNGQGNQNGYPGYPSGQGNGYPNYPGNHNGFPNGQGNDDHEPWDEEKWDDEEWDEEEWDDHKDDEGDSQQNNVVLPVTTIQ